MLTLLPLATRHSKPTPPLFVVCVILTRSWEHEQQHAHDVCATVVKRLSSAMSLREQCKIASALPLMQSLPTA